MLTFIFMLLATGQQRVKLSKKFWNKILIRDFTLEKIIFSTCAELLFEVNLLATVQFVTKQFYKQDIRINTWRFTLEKNHIIVHSVTKHFHKQEIF